MTLSQVNPVDKGSRFVTYLFSDVSKNRLLVCKMYISSVNRLITLPTVATHPRLSTVKVSTPYHEQVFRFRGVVLRKAEFN